MKTVEPSQMGSMTVQVASHSVYFGHAAAVEIRDAGMNLIARAKNERLFDLPQGLYQVSAVLEDGLEHSRLVEVRPGSNTSVLFDVSELESPEISPLESTDTPFDADESSGASHIVIEVRSSETPISRSVGIAYAPKGNLISSTDAPSELLGVNGATVVRRTASSWTFQCDHLLGSVATARYRIGDRQTEISLPIHFSEFQATNCFVRIDRSSAGWQPIAWISPDRIIASALQNMLSSGNLSAAVSMAEQAAEALREKYQDPTGAALAALILLKVGSLARFETWIENLARDFAWMPDGKLLLATLLVEQREFDRALRLVREATRQRILYTETYSLLLDLLRRWPRERDRRETLALAAELASESPYIDWNSGCLSIFSED